MFSSNEEKYFQFQTNLNLSEFDSFKIDEKTKAELKLYISFPKIRVSPSHLFKIKGEKKKHLHTFRFSTVQNEV